MCYDKPCSIVTSVPINTYTGYSGRLGLAYRVSYRGAVRGCRER